MRISVVGPVYPFRGGIAHHTALLTRHLAERHDVQLISFTRQYPRWLTDGRTDRDPSRRPVTTDAVYLLDPLNPVTWWQVGRRLRDWQPDVLVLPWWVTFWAPSWLVITWLTRRWTRARIIFLCHNVVPHEDNRVDHALATTVLGRGDAVIVQAQEQKRLLAKMLPRQHVVFTPLPSYAEVGDAGALIPARDLAAARSSLGLAGKQVLLYFGFVRPYKGLHILFDAMPLVRADVDLHLLVVGEIWEGKEHYLAQIQRLGLDACISLVDAYIPDEDLGHYFYAADAVVLPYLSATQSAVAQLAYGFGLPVIATRVGGLPDAVEDGKTGLLVPPADAPALAAAIGRFYRDGLGPILRANVRHAQSRFSWQHMVETIETLAS